MGLILRENIESADWLHLSGEEAVRWSGRPSRFTILLPIFSGFVVAGVGFVGAAILTSVIADGPPILVYLPAIVLIPLGIGWAMVAYLKWLRLSYVITDEEIYVKYGLVSRDVTQVRLDRVQNTAYQQSMLERFLGFGDVMVYTAGTNTEDILLRSVPNPVELKRTVTVRLSEIGSPESTPVGPNGRR